MESKEHITFDESSWQVIEAILPDDEDVKRAILDDFMWFIGREKIYKSDAHKVDDYVHHLQLKQRAGIERVLRINSTTFNKIDIDMLKERLVEEYG